MRGELKLEGNRRLPGRASAGHQLWKRVQQPLAEHRLEGRELSAGERNSMLWVEALLAVQPPFGHPRGPESRGIGKHPFEQQLMLAFGEEIEQLRMWGQRPQNLVQPTAPRRPAMATRTLPNGDCRRCLDLPRCERLGRRG